MLVLGIVIKTIEFRICFQMKVSREKYCEVGHLVSVSGKHII